MSEDIWDDEPAGPPPENVVPFPPSNSEGIVPLGYDRGTYFYLSRSSRQIHTMTADQHTKKALMGMASVPHFWQRTRFVGEKQQIFWDDAIDWLMSECRNQGVYNPERVRGRGAWFDDGRAVLHLGDRLLVDGRECALLLPGSNSIYPAALPLGIQNAEPMQAADAHKLVVLSQRLRWARPLSATLFAGWIVCAMVCGGLKWRPSVWIVGSSGSGKSWTSENIVTPLVGPVALQVQSKTSEAGIRQALNSDALPVIFDEFEREDGAAAVRVQGVLDLMRQSSSESEKKIIKGSQNQTAARYYQIRSCFLFSSINVGITHSADESRVSILALLQPESANGANQEAFQALARDAVALLTPEFAAGLLARSVSLLSVIRENAETFAQAVASRLGTRRQGDQIGTLLAGAYSLHRSDQITREEAEAWLDKQDWGDVVGTDSGKDEDRLLSHLTAHRIRLAQGNSAAMDLTVGRLISAAFGADERIARDTALNELRDYGIRAQINLPFGIHVSTNHPALAKILTNTPWAAGWSRTLARLPGAESGIQKNIRFGLGHVSKAVWLPLATIDPGDVAD